MGTLSSSGYSIQTFAEIKEDIQEGLRTVFGNDVNLDEETVQGYLVNWLANTFNVVEQSGLAIYNGLDLTKAVGLMLDNFAILKGTERNDGAKAIIDVDLTSSATGYTIPASSVFKVLNTEVLFETTGETSVTAFTQEIELIAKENGECALSIGDKLSSQAYFSALTDIEVTSVTEGVDAESDNVLRERLLEIQDVSSQGDVNAVYTALYNLDDVQKVKVLENATDTEDGDGVPPYSINAIVLGETTQNIVDTMYTKLSAGTPTYGAVSGTYTDIQGYSHICYFDRPSNVPIWIAASVTAKDGEVSVDGSFDTIIKENCNTYVNNLKIGTDVSYSTIYGIFAEPRAFDIVSLQMSKVSATSGMAASSVTIGVREYASFGTYIDDIYIEVV